MAVQRKKLRVLPNPWLHIDERGQPAGLCRIEQPTNGTFIEGWIGVTVRKVEEVEAPKRVTIKGRVFEQKAGIHYLHFAHADQPITVDNSPYYRKRVAAGDLVAFDEETASACGISKRNFVKPEALLEQLKVDAIKQFDAENGQGAFETLADMADEAAEAEAGVAEAVATAEAEARGETVAVPGVNAEAAATLDAAVTPVAGAGELQGVTFPADGTEHTVILGGIAGQEPLPVTEIDASGAAIMVESEAPALTPEPETNPTRPKSRRGSDQ